jgi:hypothetical protein
MLVTEKEPIDAGDSEFQAPVPIAATVFPIEKGESMC